MSDTYNLKQIDDWSLWDTFVRNAVGGTVFSTSPWLLAAEKAMGGEARAYGYYKNGHLIAGCTVIVREKGGIISASTPILTPYGGMIYAPIPAKRSAKLEAEYSKATASLIQQLQRDTTHTLLAHHPSVADMREFIWRKWDMRVHYTYLIDIGDLQHLWDLFENRTNTVIRKAEREGIVIREIEDMERFLSLYMMIYRKQKRLPPVPETTVKRFYTAVQEADLCRTYAAVVPSGEVVSAVVFVLGFDTFYAWISGADPVFNETGATSLLYWRAFEEMVTHSTRFDFVGANIPSIAKFKRGFGGELTPYYITEQYASLPFKILIKGGQVVKRVVSQLLTLIRLGTTKL